MAPSDAPSAPPSTEPSAATITCDTAIKVGLVTDVGRVNDKGFNQSAYEGMLAAAEAAPTCFETEYIETTSQSDYATNIAQFTDSGSNVVIGVGFLLGDALGDAAKANSDIKFISVDGVPGAGHDESWMTNGESLFFAEDQAGYMAGVLAASVSKTNHIGVVGGLVVVPPVERFVEGYIDGAKSVNPDIDVDFVYTTSFTDPPQGSSAAQQMIDSGADVIFGAGGLTGNGALEAACQADGVLAIGVDTDQYETLPSVQKLHRVVGDEEHRRSGPELAPAHRPGSVHPGLPHRQRRDERHRPGAVPRPGSQRPGRGQDPARDDVRRPRRRIDRPDRDHRRGDAGPVSRVAPVTPSTAKRAAGSFGTSPLSFILCRPSVRLEASVAEVPPHPSPPTRLSPRRDRRRERHGQRP